ncbi:MAG: hypothetical protein M1813_006619 [Trichoglossum hirsutum]|nr:MAG: hypothetical protein M1813_006619 [Trichoglossum hirsutum]
MIDYFFNGRVAGIDFIIGFISSGRTNRALAFWNKVMEEAGTKRNGSYTVDISILHDSRGIMTADPENIEALLGTNKLSEYGKGEYLRQNFREFVGDSILTLDGQPWHDLRRVMRPIFNKERVGDLRVFEKHVQNLVSHLGPGDGSEIDIQSLFAKYSMDVAIGFLLDTEDHNLNHPGGEFAQMWDEIQHMQAMILRAGPLIALIPRGSFRKRLRAVNSLIQPFVEQALRISPAELEKILPQSDTFLHQLARYTRDPKVIRNQIVALLLAGRETTATTLSWIFFELSRRPKVVARLRGDILEHVGPDPNAAPSYTNLKEMKYLSYVINETLRLYPAVPFNGREALKPTTLPRGGGPDGMSPVGIRAGTIIAYSTLMTQRRRDLYPPISETFPYDPADWAPERWETWTPKNWQYIPFNNGPRTCLGQQFALLEMGYAVCRIMQVYSRINTKIDVGTKVPDVMQADLVLTLATDVKVRFWKD